MALVTRDVKEMEVRVKSCNGAMRRREHISVSGIKK